MKSEPKRKKEKLDTESASGISKAKSAFKKEALKNKTAKKLTSL